LSKEDAALFSPPIHFGLCRRDLIIVVLIPIPIDRDAEARVIDINAIIFARLGCMSERHSARMMTAAARTILFRLTKRSEK
jgi:hypothetical protein